MLFPRLIYMMGLGNVTTFGWVTNAMGISNDLPIISRFDDHYND